MGGRQTLRVLIAGISGGGKSTLARELITAFEGRYRQLVIVNRKSEFAELCDKAYSVDERGDPELALRRYRKVFFRVDGYDPRPFLDALGMAVMRRREVLLVVDEAYEFFQRGRVPKALFRVITGGRELGHNCIFVTQMLQSASGGIDLAVIQQCTHLVLLRLQGENDLARARANFPELGERVLALRRPERGLPPEVAVKNMLTGEAAMARYPYPSAKRRVWQRL